MDQSYLKRGSVLRVVCQHGVSSMVILWTLKKVLFLLHCFIVHLLICFDFACLLVFLGLVLLSFCFFVTMQLGGWRGRRNLGGIGDGKTWSKYIARKKFSIMKGKNDDPFAILRHEIKSNEDIFIVHILSTQYYPHTRTKNFTRKNYFFVRVCQKSTQEMLSLLVALT